MLARAPHGEHWLWPDLPALQDLEGAAPRTLTMANERQEWARQKLDDAIAERVEALQTVLDREETPEADFREGELVLHAGGRRLLDCIYLDEGVGRLAEQYWRFLLLSQNWRDASRLSEALRRSPTEPGLPAARQFIERVDALTQQVADIAVQENHMNECLFALYGLTEAERFLVETG